MDEAQRITILSAAGSHSSIASTDTDAEIVTQLTYEKVASMLRQCDNKMARRLIEMRLMYKIDPILLVDVDIPTMVISLKSVVVEIKCHQMS